MDNAFTGPRAAWVERRTGETDVRLGLRLDGTGSARVETGVGFFDHMLTAFARHGFFDLDVRVQGDLHVDSHHTVEDTGLCLGQALREALGDKGGIRRIGSASVPMDEVLVHAVVDLSGRPFLNYRLQPAPQLIGNFDPVLAEEFFRAFAFRAGMNLHILQWAGGNSHHLIEAAFKAVARALDEATAPEPRLQGPLSTKGSLD